MEEQREYAVLRFMDQNGWSYMVNDCARGRLLMDYIKSEIRMEKGCIFEWVRQLAVQLEQYYRCEGEEGAYGYVNPYAIVIGEENHIFLLDVKEPENEELVRQMKKKKVRILFVRQEHALTQKTERMDDLYGFGKIMGFLAEKCIDPKAFTKKEQWMWKKLQGKCYGNNKTAIKTLRYIQKEMQILEKDKTQKKKKGGGRILLVVAVICMVGVVVIKVPAKGWKQVAASEEKEKIQKKQTERIELEQVDTEEKTEKQEENENTKQTVQDAYLELGLLYYEERQDYENSLANLEKAGKENTLANGYRQIIRYLQRGNVENVEEKSIEELLNSVTGELEKLSGEKIRGKEFLYHYPLMKFCELSECYTGWFEMRKIGKELENKKEWQNWETDGAKEKEMRLCMVSAYQGIGLTEKTAEEYEYIKELTEDRGELERIYVKMLELYELSFQKEKAWEICHEAVEKVKDSETLWLKYVTYYCEDTAIDRAVCAEAVKKAVEAVPEICNTEQFRFLQMNYGIRIEGDTVVVGAE